MQKIVVDFLSPKNFLVSLRSCCKMFRANDHFPLYHYRVPYPFLLYYNVSTMLRNNVTRIRKYTTQSVGDE